ncbi:MAG TPA: efflux transporter periplasmic adaptor subunit, partial [Rhodanobacter sp.]
GAVTGVAQVITDNGNPAGTNLLATVNTTLNWVRLARRVQRTSRSTSPRCPKACALATGMTATTEVWPQRTESARASHR